MKKIAPRVVPGFNIEHIPKQVADTIWPELPVNGGNCISVDNASVFGQWLQEQGVVLSQATWGWVVVWR